MPQAPQVLSRKLATFMRLSPAETRCLADLQTKPLRVKAGAALVREGESGHLAYILQSGWACSFKLHRTAGVRSLPSHCRATVSAYAASCCVPPTTPSRH
jgi:CRP-like cAMP-binding protein